MTNTTNTPRMSQEDLEWAQTVVSVWLDVLDGKSVHEAWHGKRPQSTTLAARERKWTR